MEFIKIIAETVGVPHLKDEIAEALAADVEYRIREIAQVCWGSLCAGVRG